MKMPNSQHRAANSVRPIHALRGIVAWALVTGYASAMGQNVAADCQQRYPLDGNLNAAIGSPNGTSTGVLTYSAGQFGQAAVFDSTTKLDFGNIAKPQTADFTISCWMKTTANLAMAVLGRRQICNYGSFWNLRTQASGTIFFEINQATSADNTSPISVSKLNDGIWHHVVGRRTGTEVVVFVDGMIEQVKTSPFVLNVSSNSATVKAGTGPCDTISNTTFRGSLDEIQLYSRSLSLAEMRTIGGFGGVTPVTISGSVTLGEWPLSPAGAPVDVRLVRNGTILQTLPATLDGAGNFSVTTTARGPFQLSVKASHWLSNGSSQQITDSGITGFATTLTNGDIDGDNTVSLFDYLILSDAFDSARGDAAFVDGADLDGDDVISLFDYLILSSHFDEEGF